MKQVILAILTLILLASCVTSSSPTTASGNIIPTLIQTVQDNKSNTPSPLPSVSNMAGTPTATLAQQPRATKTPRPTRTVHPTETISDWAQTLRAVTPVTPATAVPTPNQDNFYKDLIELGYQLLQGSSIVGPGGYTYSAYLFYKDIYIDDWDCRIAFYRLDNQENVFLYSFPAPRFPGYDFEPGNPYRCWAMNWNNPDAYLGYMALEPEIINDLDLNGNWSDINQNGLPEFAINYQYCKNGCWDTGELTTHFYEIQTTSRIADLTAELPGVIEPFNLIHSKSPYTFYVYDTIHEMALCWGCLIETWWVYGWDGENLVDVTAQFKDEYLAQGQQIIQEIQAQYKSQYILDRLIMKLLFHYEKAALRKQAVQDFMTVTELTNWVNVSQIQLCWLQIARASAQEDYRLGRPFQFPPLSLHFPFIPEEELPYALSKTDATRYDVSICQNIMKTLTP